MWRLVWQSHRAGSLLNSGMISKFYKLFTPRSGLALLLLLTLLKGLAWSVIVPPWHAPDEITHFTYAQIIERFGVLHPSPGNWLNAEIGSSWDLAQIHPVRYDPSKILDLSDRKTISGRIVDLNDPALKYKYVYDDGLYFPFYRNFTFSHPPLYYLLNSAVQALFENQTILVRILAERWLSALLGVVLTALAFRGGRLVFQNDAWALLIATLVAFQPMASFMTAVVNNNALEIVLFSASLVTLLAIVRHGYSTGRAIALGALGGASLLTHVSLVGLAPLALVALIWDARRQWQIGKLDAPLFGKWFLSFAIAVALAGWWYVQLFSQSADTPIREMGAVDPTVVATSSQVITQYDLLGISTRVAGQYWGNFGWLDTPLPSALMSGLIWFSAIGFALTVIWFIRRKRAVGHDLAPRPGVILFLGLGILSTCAFYFYLDASVGYGLQGRYFLPPIIGQMSWLALGWVWLAPARWRAGSMWVLGVGMIALNLYALFSVIALRYYGARNLLLLVDRATVLQPLSSNTLLALIAVYFLALALFLPAFWRTLHPRLEKFGD